MVRDRSIDTASTKENIHKMKIMRLKEVKTRCQPDEEQKVLYQITQVLFSLHLFRAKHTLIHENIKYHSLCRNCFRKLLVDTCERYWPHVIRYLLPANNYEEATVPGPRLEVIGRDFRDKFYKPYYQACTRVGKKVEPDADKRRILKASLKSK